MNNVKILIVDDVPENLFVLGEVLSDFNVKIAKDGKRAIEIADATPDLSLIMLDIMMPGIDGYETCRRLKENENTSQIPVIFMTALSETEDIVKGFEIGAVDYITKPIKGKELLARVNTHITLSLLQKEMKSINKVLEAKVVERTAELQAAKEKAEESSKIKSHFMSLMSHELRTPMNGILGYAEILMSEVNVQEWKEYSEGIYSAGSMLKETLNSILNLARLESSENEINVVKSNIFNQIENIIKRFTILAARKNLNLQLVSEGNQFFALIDETMYDIIVSNLVSNAIKYTDRGSVEISAEIKSENGKNFLITKIKDTGIGIPRDKFDLIFEEFRQVDEGQGRNFEGVGLGLTITKKYVKKLKGTISLESRLREGSTFIVELPVGFVETKHLNEEIELKERSTSAPVKILIVEDDESNIKVMKLFLRRMVADIDVSRNGEGAIELAKENKYDIIMMDINLGSGLNGVETTAKIRNLTQYKTTPIIAVTAYAFEKDKDEFLKEGFTNYLAKPYIGKDLISLIESSLK